MAVSTLLTLLTAIMQHYKMASNLQAALKLILLFIAVQSIIRFQSTIQLEQKPDLLSKIHLKYMGHIHIDITSQCRSTLQTLQWRFAMRDVSGGGPTHNIERALRINIDSTYYVTKEGGYMYNQHRLCK